MKTMIQIQLITSIIILFNLGCTKENNSVKSQCDSTNCTYDSICLDYQFYDAINKEELIGEWKFIAYVDTIDCEIVKEPLNIPRTVFLKFHENDSISGESVNNTITGKYSIINNKISFYDIRITLVMEPDWGRTFLEAINYTEYFTLINNMLIINSKDILIFTKK